jgi:hypothetical protein
LKSSLSTASSQGRRQRGGFYFFVEKTRAEGPWQTPSAKMVFYFFEKILRRASLAKAVGKDGFLFFLKKFFAERLVQLRSAKLGTPELGKFFPELLSVIAKSTRQRLLCR